MLKIGTVCHQNETDEGTLTAHRNDEGADA